jgi:hypothetical protein
MSFTVIPRGPKPKPAVPLHRYMYRAIRDIEQTSAPTNSWSQTLLANIVHAMRSGADELERAIELRVAEYRAVHQEKLAGMRECENDARNRK